MTTQLQPRGRARRRWTGAARAGAILAAAGAASALTGCGDTTAPNGATGIAVVAGADVSDTVRTALARPLVVEVRDETGSLAAGVVVRFQAVPPATPVPLSWWQPGLSVSLRPTPEAAPREFVFDTTDSHGRASVYVTLGTVAGPAAVTVNAPALSLDARASFTVRPGNAVGLRAEPADSALYVGNSYTLRGATVDWYGNVRDDAVTYSATPSHVSVSAAGRIAGQSLGRDRVIVARGEWRDTAWVTVVPRGELLAVRERVGGPDTAFVVRFALDGSGYMQAPVHYLATPRPDWSPDGRGYVMEASIPEGFDSNHLVVVDEQGTRRRLVSPETGLQQEFYPRYSADGAWIYFSGSRPSLQGHLEHWRVHPDGSGAERVGLAAGYYEGDLQPAPSPDGRRVAYSTDRFCCGFGLTLRVLDLSTGVVDSLFATNGGPLPGTMPNWSPDGTTIAYTREAPERGSTNANRIWLMNPDGSGQRVVSRADLTYRPGVDWSPDGKWIVARCFDDGRLHLIEVATGLTLPLGYSAQIGQPAWRP